MRSRPSKNVTEHYRSQQDSTAPPTSPRCRSPSQLSEMLVPAPAGLVCSSPQPCPALATAGPGPPAAQWEHQGCPQAPSSLAGLVGWGLVITSCPDRPPPVRAPFLLDSASQGCPWHMWHPGQWGPLHKAAYTFHCKVMQSLIPRNLNQRTPCFRHKGEVTALHTVMGDSEVSVAPALGTQRSHC